MIYIINELPIYIFIYFLSTYVNNKLLKITINKLIVKSEKLFYVKKKTFFFVHEIKTV